MKFLHLQLRLVIFFLYLQLYTGHIMVLCGLSCVNMSNACLIYFVLTHFLQTNNVVRNGGPRVCKFLMNFIFFPFQSYGTCLHPKENILFHPNLLLALTHIYIIQTSTYLWEQWSEGLYTFDNFR